MKRYDGHIHIHEGRPDPGALARSLREAGFSGALLISLPPDSFGKPRAPRSFEERLANLMEWSIPSAGLELFPFFWLDPLDADAATQADAAVGRGVAGFKMICTRCEPGHPRVLAVLRKIASLGRPVLFHSGILWDGHDSSRYNRPVLFEALLDVPGLVFSLAHIGWPWFDELIAVYGKFLNALDHEPRSAEMYVDLTPGTPPIYRREALTRLFTVGYAVEEHAIFGTDCQANDYNCGWAREWLERDGAIYDELGLGPRVREEVGGENLRRFLGLQAEKTPRKVPRPGES